jgi:S1-C subfamily serine protease
MTQYSSLQQLQEERRSLLASVLPRVGSVTLGRRRAVSAIRYRADLLVTAAEPLADAERVEVSLATGSVTAQVLALDLATDVAVLRLAGVDTWPSDAAPAVVNVGDAVALVGRDPRGPIASWGSVRLAGPAWRSLRGGKIAQRLEFDVRFDPVLEGAAVVDLQGRLVAMAVVGPWRRMIGIPAATIEEVVSQVEQHGHLTRPYLGVRLQPLWLDDAGRAQLGRSVRSVPVVGGIEPGSPAATAHLELGDLVLRADGQVVESGSALAQRVAEAGAGQVMAIEVLRGGQPLVVHVSIGARPAA